MVQKRYLAILALLFFSSYEYAKSKCCTIPMPIPGPQGVQGIQGVQGYIGQQGSAPLGIIFYYNNY